MVFDKSRKKTGSTTNIAPTSKYVYSVYILLNVLLSSGDADGVIDFLIINI